MERLTIKKRFKHHRPDEETTAVCVDGYIQIVEPIEYATHATSHYYLVGKAIDKLAEYEDAEEQGLLVRLPTKVGDAVYSLECGMIARDFVYSFTTDESGLWAINIHGGIIGLFGNSVFSTLEEAEKALEEMKK